MREIKFRGKRIDNGKWVEGGFAIIPPPLKCFQDGIEERGKTCIVAEHEGYVADWNMPRQMGMYDVDPATIGQYTGLRDKNGTQIFEGDVIELINADYETIRIVCEFGAAIRQIYENTVEITGFYFTRSNDGRKTFPTTHNYLGKHDKELYTVIGNIHDIPELIKEDEKC